MDALCSDEDAFNVCAAHTRCARCRYGESLGDPQLRDLIAEKLYGSTGIKGGDIIVSDGSKCDIGRVQMMFGEGISVAAQVRFALMSKLATHRRVYNVCK